MYTILFNFVTFNSHMKWGREKKLFILYSFKKKKRNQSELSGVGFEPTLSLENQSLNLAP